MGVRVTVFDGVGDAAAELFEVHFGEGGLLLRIQKRGQFTPAGLQGGDLCGEGLDSLPAGGLGEGAGLEGEKVPFDGFFGLGQLGVDHAELVLVLTALRTGSGETGGKRSLEEVVALDGPKQRPAHFALQLVGGEPFCRTGGGPVALTGEAGVVAVAVLVAVRGGPDVALAAPSARDETGKEVVAGVGGPVRVVLTP
ncbi:MAG: hypothetical protein ABSA65_07640 [Acidimicrobiales bacterium]